MTDSPAGVPVRLPSRPTVRSMTKSGGTAPAAKSACIALGFLVQRRGEGLQAREIGLGVLGRLDAVLGVQEVRNAVVGPAQLVDRIGRREALAVGELVAGGDRVAEIFDRVVVDLAARGQGLAVDGLHLGHEALEHHLVSLDLGGGAVVEARFQGGHRPGVQTQHGHRLGRRHDHLLDDALHQAFQGRGGGLLTGEGQNLAGGGQTGPRSGGEKKAAAIDHGEAPGFSG